ncbi:GCN5-related N-acetyltransferase [Ameyamaea chiangmaiensis NBRC 103196]|uniref:GNAT family N-acetyltransferase n=1 Tax=Ameyamaea chiangmaiensis TaxID=442969 RepID=UPI002156ABB1|nr:GNAT family protein [Ameyamaea chiangmaiensis]GBQ71443.1 GCN5-related N-acetyltransferase [Ameyamaea chiangmaiensis NBRC 103196]
MASPLSPPFAPVTLEGHHVRLAPLSHADHDGLVDAVRDAALAGLWYTSVPTPDTMRAEIDRRLGLQAAGSMIPFTVFDVSGTVVGMTTYMHIDAAVPRVEIGSTWYVPAVQRTGLNTEAKFLLLRHAFEGLGCAVVEFRTHFLNQQSRRAIERLGAKLDGVLRAHMRMNDGSVRDTCVYSVLASEWPSVRSHLRWQLDRPRA